MIENDARLRELGAKAVQGQMTDDEFAELALLSRAKQKLREERTTLIADLKDKLRNHGVTIQELYTPAEIAAAVRGSNEGPGLRVKGASVKPQTTSAVRTWVRQKTGVILIEIHKPGTNGLPCRYCKGQLLPYYVAAGLKELDDGQLDANLERHYTDEGKRYFATDEGRTELAQLVQYIHTHKTKPKK